MPNWDDGAAYDISFAVNKSRRYHSMMQAHYQRLHDTSSAISAVAGSGTFIALLQQNIPAFAKWLAAIVAVASALDTIFRFSRKASLHDRLSQKFTVLSTKILALAPDDKNIEKMEIERVKIEREEPPEKVIINMLSQNQEARSRGVSDEKLFEIGFFDTHLGFYTSIREAAILRKRELRRQKPPVFMRPAPPAAPPAAG